MNDDVETFFDLAESFVTYVKHCYEEEMDQGIKDDVADAIEQVFQYGMLVIDDADGRYVVIDMLQNLVLLMKSASRGCVHVSKHGRPKIDIGEEQLSYLIKQGFRTKEISKIFGCSRRTVERRMNEYELSLLNSMAVSDASRFVSKRYLNLIPSVW